MEVYIAEKRLLLIFSCVLLIFIFGFISYFSTQTVKTDNRLENYRKYNYLELYINPDYTADLAIFPEKIEDYMKVEKYEKLEIFQGPNRKSGGIFLEVEYTETAYNDEILRLENWHREYTYNEEKGIGRFLFDKERNYFQYPTYIASYNALTVYEYASLLGNNKIIYVYLSCLEEKEMIIPRNYLPLEYYNILEQQKQDTLTALEKSYSVYYNVDMWRYDNDEGWDISF